MHTKLKRIVPQLGHDNEHERNTNVDFFLALLLCMYFVQWFAKQRAVNFSPSADAPWVERLI